MIKEFYTTTHLQNKSKFHVRKIFDVSLLRIIIPTVKRKILKQEFGFIFIPAFLDFYYCRSKVTGYDAKGRMIWSQSKNSYLETNDIIESNLDFLGKTTESKTHHIKGTAPSLIIRDYFVYDNYQRPLQQSQKICTGELKLIFWNKYDNLGKIDEKKVGGILPQLRPSYDQYQAYQRINYTSNIRGWLTGINNWTTQDNDLFSFSIDYSTH